jgi:hypothetical protein
MQVSTRRFLTSLPPANRLAVFNPHFMYKHAVPISLLSAAAFVDLLAAKSPNPAFQLSRKATSRRPVQNLGAASLPNLNRMRHRGLHQSINSLLFIAENRQFHKFIMITMILTYPHDSAICWEEVLGVL